MISVGGPPPPGTRDSVRALSEAMMLPSSPHDAPRSAGAAHKVEGELAPASAAQVAALLKEQRRTNRLLQAMLWVAVGFVVGLCAVRLAANFH